MKKKYFVFLFASAILTRIWYSDIFSNYSYSLTDALLALLIFYGICWLLWEIGKILLSLFARGTAIIDGEEKANPESFKDFISWLIAGISFVVLLNLLLRIF